MDMYFQEGIDDVFPPSFPGVQLVIALSFFGVLQGCYINGDVSIPINTFFGDEHPFTSYFRVH